MTKRLRRYLAAREAGGWGWKAKYERKEMPDDQDWPWLVGFYGGMLDELLDAIGEKQISKMMDEYDSPKEKAE